MKYYKLNVLFVMMIFVQCASNTQTKINIEEIKGTKWSIEIAENCISTLNFMEDKKYIDYNCEMEDTLFGTYDIINNYLVLYQEGSIYDKLYDENSSQRVGKAKFKLTLENNQLRYLIREDYFNGEWVKSKHTFSSDYFYKKEL